MLRLILLVTTVLNLTLISAANAGRKEYRIRSLETSSLTLQGENFGAEFEGTVNVSIEWEEVFFGTVEVPVVDTYEDPTCSPMYNEVWGQFYGTYATFSEKRNALEKIKGIGESTSKKITSYWPYYSPPATWNEFKRVIRDLDEIAPGLYHNVVETHGSYNKSLLGYRQYCDDITVIRYVEQEVELHREDAGIERYEVNIQGSGALLFKGETDVLTFSAKDVGGYRSELIIQESQTKNTYSILNLQRDEGEFNSTYYVQLEASRKKVRPSNSIGAVISIENKRVYLLANINDFDLAYKEIIGGTLYVNFSVATNKDCFMCWLAKERRSSSQAIEVQAGQIKIDTGYNIASDDEELIVKYSTSYSGSVVFNGSKSGSKEVTRKLK